MSHSCHIAPPSVGKHKRLVIGAAMRKLLVLAYGILRSGVAFDANYA
jgi:hypothetical protein